MNHQPGLLARKLGMTQIFTEDGTRIPVTVLSVKGNRVTAHRTTDRDGYTALQLGFEEQKAHRLTKADLGRFKAAGVEPSRKIREFRVPGDTMEKFAVGSELKAEDIFSTGDAVDVTGTSKGKGFAGVMKRYHFRGKSATHGTHEYFRHGGSIGCRLTPGRVMPGKKMGGHMGHERVTIQNLQVARIDGEDGVILVKGAVPGPNQGLVAIRPSHKNAIRKSHGGK